MGECPLLSDSPDVLSLPHPIDFLVSCLFSFRGPAIAECLQEASECSYFSIPTIDLHVHFFHMTKGLRRRQVCLLDCTCGR